MLKWTERALQHQADGSGFTDTEQAMAACASSCLVAEAGGVLGIYWENSQVVDFAASEEMLTAALGREYGSVGCMDTPGAFPALVREGNVDGVVKLCLAVEDACLQIKREAA
jgi:hypothetical protein